MLVFLNEIKAVALKIKEYVSSTKRNTPIEIRMETSKKGDKVEKGEPISWSNMFNGDLLVQGKNVKLAIMNYMNISYEDGYVISNEMAESFETKTLIKIPALVPPDVNILNFISENIETEKGDVLLEFEYADKIDDYLDKFNINSMLNTNDKYDSVDNTDLFLKSGNSIRTISPGGKIVDIKIKINNLKLADPVIIDKWKKNTTNIKKRDSEIKKHSLNKEKFLDNTDLSVLKTHNHKDDKQNEFEGALIEFYIQVTKPMNKADKMCNRFGAKGVVTDIIPEGKIPYTDYSGNIDIFLAPAGVIGRKNTGILKELYLGKVFYFFKDIIAKMVRKDNAEEIKQIIIGIYMLLDPTDKKTMVKSLEETLNSYKKDELLKLLSNKEIEFNYILPPFNAVDLKNILTAMKRLGIPTKEKIYIPELKQWSKAEVPVGIQYYSAMEQISSDHEATRAIAKYVSATGQPSKGKKNNGGQSFGNLDIYAMLTYDATNIIKELMTIRSDFFTGKSQMINQIRENGSFKMKDINIGKSKTTNLKDMLFKGMGLRVT